MRTTVSIIILLLASVESIAQGQEKKVVVFVCEHGAARSVIASVYFNKMAEENKLPFVSVFRGLHPDSVLTPETKRGLVLDGFAIESLVPSQLDQTDCTDCHLVSLDCEVPKSYTVQHAWKGIPTISKDYRVARDEIMERVKALIEELKKSN